jgi:hypothetical protein
MPGEIGGDLVSDKTNEHTISTKLIVGPRMMPSIKAVKKVNVMIITMKF